MLSSASRAYGKVKITEMGCVDMYNPVLEPHIKFKTMQYARRLRFNNISNNYNYVCIGFD